MPEIVINEVRLSCILMEAWSSLLSPSGGLPSESPMAFLGQSTTYAQEFAKLAAGSGELAKPWDPKKGIEERFWYHYLGNCEPESIASDKAWKCLVPFRKSIIPNAKTGSPGGRWWVEAFYYPHGVAAVGTVVVQGKMTIKEAVDKTRTARTSGRYGLAWPGKPVEPLSMDFLLSTAIRRLRDAALGEGQTVEDPYRPGQAFTIVTIIRGSGASVDAPNQASDPVHRCLEGLCSWHATWEYDKLDSAGLEKAKLEIRSAPDGHLLYGRERSRAVWFPGLFTSNKPIHSLGRYHRNLTFASVQTESLLGLMHLIAPSASGSPFMSASMEDLTRRAAGIMGQLYGGVDDTYRCWSPRRQIDDSKLVAVINDLRHKLGREPLK